MSHLLGYNLKNINQIKQNTEGIDLIDENNKIIAQVSSTCTKQKIENSLAKEIFQEYPDFNFNFIAIVGDADQLRTKAFKNPHKISFNPLSDIYDINSLLNIILNLDISKQRKLYEFIKNELGSDIDIVKVDSNLATIINILSQEKIEFNDLLSVQPTIDDYKIFYSKLDEKYKEFDK